jgi:hypothetical protein
LDSHLSVPKFYLPSPFFPVDPFHVVNSLISQSRCYWVTCGQYISTSQPLLNFYTAVIATISSYPNSSRCWVGTDLIYYAKIPRPRGFEPALHLTKRLKFGIYIFLDNQKQTNQFTFSIVT